MRQLSLAALLAAAFAIAQTQAQAQAPAQTQDRSGPVAENGQCKHYNSKNHNGMFFYWGECRKLVAAVVAPHHAHRRHG